MIDQGEKMAAHLWHQALQNAKYLKRKYGASLDIERPEKFTLECNSCGKIDQIETELHPGKDKTIPCSFCDNGRMRVLF